MDIAKLSTTLSQIDTASKFSIAMLDKNLETSESLGANLVNMIDAAAIERTVNPNIGSNIDLFV